MTTRRTAAATAAPIRCAIYTRKSSEEGLEQQFNSLDAQRESGEAFIASQKHEGWEALPDRYDDGGFSGGTVERPALKRLLADIQAGRVDAVVVYKVDRLSRSLLDFSRLMETFEKHKVAFVSVTQNFATNTSMGRLMLNVLLSFAQFEREIISERTRDKIHAARRRGMWAGGRPVLGYDLSKCKLTLNEEEAERVRAIFDLYLGTKSLTRAVAELSRRRWTNKRWVTAEGREMGGQPFTKATLHRLLTSVLYVGKIPHNGEVFAGEQPAIVDEAVWTKVQALLQENGRCGGSEVRNVHGALLKGLLRCRPCGCAMTHTFTTKGNKCFRYYVCAAAAGQGRDACPSRSLPSEQIEAFVVDRIRAVGRDPELVTLILDLAREQDAEQAAAFEAELRAVERELRLLAGRTRKAAGGGEGAAAELADAADRTRAAEARAAALRMAIAEVTERMVTRGQVDAATAAFDPLWQALSTKEKTKVLRLLIKRVEYDGKAGEVTLTFHDEASWLAQEVAS